MNFVQLILLNFCLWITQSLSSKFKGKTFNVAFSQLLYDEQNFNQSLKDFYDPKFVFNEGEKYVGPNFQVVAKDAKISFQCDNMFQKLIEISKVVVTWPPDCSAISNDKKLVDQFTIGGKLSLGISCAAERQNGVPKIWQWTPQLIEQASGSISQCGAYGTSACVEAISKYNHLVKGKVGMVIGSQNPWAEEGLIKFGAKHIITQEYNPINSSHPRISTITPLEVAHDWLKKKQDLVDFVFTFSSLEHDGLGRYGFYY